MNTKKLYGWYSSKEYDPENRELNKIIKLGKIKNKNILIFGDYGISFLYPKLLRYAKSIEVFSENKKIIKYLNKIKYTAKFSEEDFNCIISAWNGLHYHKNLFKLIKKFKKSLKYNGILLIEEANPESEFVGILNIIFPKKLIIKEKLSKLKRILNKEFKVKEYKLSTYYRFKNKKSFKNYFRNEILFHERKKFSKDIENKLDNYISIKRSLKVGEKALFFVCKLI